MDDDKLVRRARDVSRVASRPIEVEARQVFAVQRPRAPRRYVQVVEVRRQVMPPTALLVEVVRPTGGQPWKTKLKGHGHDRDPFRAALQLDSKRTWRLAPGYELVGVAMFDPREGKPIDWHYITPEAYPTPKGPPPAKKAKERPAPAGFPGKTAAPADPNGLGPRERETLSTMKKLGPSQTAEKIAAAVYGPGSAAAKIKPKLARLQRKGFAAESGGLWSAKEKS